MRTTDIPRPVIGWSTRSVLIIWLAVSALFATSIGAHADQHTFSRGISGACTAYAQQLDRFPDVDPGGVHAPAVDCLAHWEIVSGRVPDGGDPRYAPDADVSRAAMASYVARTLQRSPNPEVPVPEPTDDRFPDHASGVHADNVHVLRAAGIVQGRDDGSYDPWAPVDRAAMASYIAGMIEFVIDDEIPVGDDFDPAFPDTGGVHEQNIDKLATLGIVSGRPDGTYGPGEPVSRAAMASFVAGAMDYLAFRGYLPVAFEVELRPEVDHPVPENLNRRINGEVVDQFGNGYFGAEVRLEIYRAGTLVLTTSQTSGLGGAIAFSYNADADAGDSDDLAACIVDADQSPPVDGRFCLDEAGDPIEGRRVTELTVGWADALMPTDAPAEGEFHGEAVMIDRATNTLWFQPIPPSDDPVLLLRFDYVEDAKFQVNGENVVTAAFECAVAASIADERNGHLLDIFLGPETWNTYGLATSTDVSDCF